MVIALLMVRLFLGAVVLMSAGPKFASPKEFNRV